MVFRSLNYKVFTLQRNGEDHILNITRIIGPNMQPWGTTLIGRDRQTDGLTGRQVKQT